MNNPQHTLPPTGWYPDPKHGVGVRYWNGELWTSHVSVSGQMYLSPMEDLPVKKQRKIYWSNLFRFRVWWFSLTAPFVIILLAAFVGLNLAILYLPMVIATGWFWLTQQMACAQCGTALRVTRLSGDQKVCHKCGSATDKA